MTFVMYDQMTALDLVGPYQVLAAVPDAEIRLAAVSAGPQRTDTGLAMVADYALSELEDSELILVPGTGRPDLALADSHLVDWLRCMGPRATWLCSVCTGSLILGAAGLLKGRRATTHWLARPALLDFGAEVVESRTVFDAQLVTAAGVSAGIDMALTLVERIWGRALAETIQLTIEYDPEPPQQAGSPQRTTPAIVEAATRALMQQLSAAVVG
jgi:transcriptional regulator GlxA family with amidase domain